MPNIDETAKAWQSELAQRFGDAVATYRKERGIKAAELADRTRDLGYPIHRVAITKIETNSRGGKLDLAEVITLALALGVPPVQLIYPGLPGGQVDVWPRIGTSEATALQWFSGEIRASDIFLGPWTEASTNARVQLAREYVRAKEVRKSAALNYRDPASASDEVRQAFRIAQDRVEEIEQQIRANGWPIDDA
ncbi:helix-turn-helix domain-containing protein [Nocardia fusca]|uniref:helix-turn-helix domain-containing protein n=1 Tax=Nocardia fusca TaxID=941183 RepID=UPI0018DB37AD|nr:helix-turn-helix transcriptional regulator [Nocardia fusca]